MKTYKQITILSTFAEDTLVDNTGSVISRQKGGPAFYLAQAFGQEKASFDLRTGPAMNVRIFMTKSGELGEVPQKPKQTIVEFSKIKTPYLAISSVLNEFNLDKLPSFEGKVFLDIQGYVRNGNDFGKKKLWKPRQEIFENILCLKGTKEEMENIPTEFTEKQKQKILLITNGKNGCEVFAFGKRYAVKPKRAIKTNNKIGAGDTFFAYFIIQFIQTEKILDSVKYAVDKTSEFLSVVNIHHHNQLFLEEIGCG